MPMPLLILIVLAAVTATAGGGDAGKVKLTPQEQAVLDQTNEQRKKEGLKPLVVNATLVEVARKHAQAMAKLRKMEHVIDGIGPDERFKKAGYKFATYGENIHWSKGLDDKAADLAMKDWLASKVHRGNLLSKDFTEVGIGVATNDAGETYFTQDFGRPLK
jgi:uncharacterized protein YkwD